MSVRHPVFYVHVTVDGGVAIARHTPTGPRLRCYTVQRGSKRRRWLWVEMMRRQLERVREANGKSLDLGE